jgi:hypothetical protein
MKDTAVKFLIDEISYRFIISEELRIAMYKAIEMEKEQIIDAFKLNIEKEYYEQIWAHCGSRNHMAEQYYNQNFKAE